MSEITAISSSDDITLPEGWQRVKIGDLLEDIEGHRKALRVGQRLLENDQNYNGQGIPCFGSQEIKAYKYVERSEGTPLIRADKEGTFPVFPPESLLIIRAGANSGRVGIIRERATANNNIYLAHFDSEKVEVDYIYWWFKSPIFQRQLKTKVSGVAQFSWNQPQVKSIEIPLPPLDIQKRILQRIEALMVEIEQARKIVFNVINDTNQLIGVALDDVFSDANRREWSNEQDLNQLTNSSSREIKADELKRHGGVQYIGGAEIEKGTCRLVQEHTIDKIDDKGAKKFCEPGSILYQTLRPELRKAVFMKGPSICSQDIIALTVKPGKNLLPRFLMWALVSSHFTEFASKYAYPEGRDDDKTSNEKRRRPRINKGDLLSYKLRFPNEDNQTVISSRLDMVQDNVGEMQRILAEQKALVEQMEQSILDQAFRDTL